MRTQGVVWLLVVWALLAPSRCPAEDVPPITPSKINAARLRWIQYTMVAGRVAVSSVYQGTQMTHTAPQVDGRRERLQIQINPGQINLRFELIGPADELLIELIGSNQLSIRRTRPKDDYTLRFEQSAGEPLMLVVEESDSRRAIEAESFWHLYLAEPQLVRRHLIPLLEILRPSWQLASLGASVEDALVGRALTPRQPPGQRWAQLVADLASPSFARRETAQRELAGAGPVVVPYLQNLDRNQLDAEQASRVRAIVESLSAVNEDTRDRIATWLAGDSQVWLSLMERPEMAKRRVAAVQLAVLEGTAIEFDPTGDEPRRQAEIERLRNRLQKPKSATAKAN
jgi:hypothetical protein